MRAHGGRGRDLRLERETLSLSLMEMLLATERGMGVWVMVYSHVEESKRLPLTNTFNLNNEFDSKLIDLNRKG